MSFKKLMFYTVLAVVIFGLIAIHYTVPTPPPPSPLQEFAPALARASVVLQLQEAFRRMRVDATVKVDDDNDKGLVYLVISGYPVDKPFAHEVASTPELTGPAKRAGFTHIKFDQGEYGHYTGVYSLDSGIFIPEKF